MARSFAVKLFTCVLVATIVAAPQAFACTQCCNIYSPCCWPQILYDNYFDEGCAWSFTGSASVVNGSAQLSSIGTVYQTVTIASGATDQDLTVYLDVVPGSNPGTERVAIEVLDSGGSVVQTVDTFTSSYSDGQYQYQLANYSGQTITIRFRMMVMPSPGDTVYRLDQVLLHSS